MSFILKKFYLYFLLIVGFIAFCIGIVRRSGPVKSPAIICTTTILADTVRELVGPDINVESLMGPGVDPHLYQARPSDIQKLNNAHVIMYHGLHLEGKISSLFEELKSTHTIVNASNGCSTNLLRPTSFDNLFDPHIWHDIELWLQVTDYLTKELIQAFPEHATVIIKNAQHYTDVLKNTHEQIKAMIASLPEHKRILITAHDAFSYYGARYGLRVIGLQGLSTDAAITTQDIEKIADIIIEHNVAAIFIETSIAPKSLQAVRQVVQSRGGDVQFGNELYSDALGTPNKEADTYIAMMFYNTKAIIEGLSYGS